MSKVCIECGVLKPLSDFYASRSCADGHLTKCIDCVKAYAKNRHHTLKNDPVWLSKERKRHREKTAKARTDNPGYWKKYTHLTKQWQKDHPLEKRAHRAALRALKSGKIIKPAACEKCGASHPRLQMHHEDHTKQLEIVWVCPKCHGLLHRKPIPSVQNQQP